MLLLVFRCRLVNLVVLLIFSIFVVQDGELRACKACSLRLCADENGDSLDEFEGLNHFQRVSFVFFEMRRFQISCFTI